MKKTYEMTLTVKTTADEFRVLLLQQALRAVVRSFDHEALVTDSATGPLMHLPAQEPVSALKMPVT